MKNADSKKYSLLSKEGSYLTTLHCSDTGHKFTFDETLFIGQTQSNAGRLFIEATHSDKNSINGHITLDSCYALIKNRLT